MTQTSVPKPSAPAAPAAQTPRQRISTAELMQNARAIIVLHQGEEYLLRITKAGKLILTK
ncbi:MAG: hemin uptake protein HemP [Candidatus Tectimicrobiota bacterium]